MTTAPIPMENLAQFLDADLSCAVWWSPRDGAVLGVFVECNIAAVGTAGEVRELVSRRPAKCATPDEDDESWDCCCDYLCLSKLGRAIEEHTLAYSIVWFASYDHPEHPGMDELNCWRDLWATEMGWLEE